MNSHDNALSLLILDLAEKWQAFVETSRQQETYGLFTDQEKGFIDGFEAASLEIRTLIAQVKGLPTEPVFLQANGELDFEIVPDVGEKEPEWEYLYVTFEQTPDGAWYLKDVKGLWRSPWKTTPTFAEAVAQLREREGWRLVNFAKGIHVFRRPHRSE